MRDAWPATPETRKAGRRSTPSGLWATLAILLLLMLVVPGLDVAWRLLMVAVLLGLAWMVRQLVADQGHAHQVEVQAMASALGEGRAAMEQAARSTERAQRESAAYRHTVDQIAMVCVTSPEGNIIEVSEAFCQACGYTREELVGQNPRMLSSGEHDPFFWVAVWQTLLHREPWSGTICNRRKDGELCWLQCVIAPIVNDEGELDRYMALSYDITEAKRHEQALTLSTERFNLAIEGSNDGLWERMNVHEDAEWWSPQVYRLLGYEPSELTATHTSIETLLHPEDRHRSAAAIQRSADQNEAIDVEYRLRVKGGEYRWFRVRARTYFDDFGQPTRMAGTIQDVHDRVQAQAALSAYGKQLAAIFSLSPDGFVSFDAEGRVWYVSPAFERLTGLHGSALLGLDEQHFGQQLFARVAPHQHIADLDAVKQLSASDEGEADAEGRRAVVELLPPGKCSLELRISRREGGAVSQVLHVRDVTHETEVEQMKSAFLSMAAHELRTPMASIYGFAELLLTRELSAERQRDLLGRIHRQSEAMTGIINELLDLARIEERQGKEFVYEACDFAALAQEVITDFKRPEGREPPLFDAATSSATVWVDRQKLQQALLNVISNAYKYSPDGGAVEIQLLRREEHGHEWLGLSVRDHGIGLSPEDLKRVGERFFRADKSGAIPGTGLGVTIVREILGLMGGRVEMSSVLGEGSTVTLWLPAATSAQMAEPLQQGQAQEKGATNGAIEWEFLN